MLEQFPPLEGESLFAGYEMDPSFYDEMFEPGGAPREHCGKLWKALDSMSRAEITTMQERAERSFLHEGITFAVYGEEGAQERIIPIDLLPRILDGGAWDLIERGLRQRLEALNLFLADVYGPARCLADEVIPVDLVRDCPQYRIEMRGVEVPHGNYVSVCGTDLIRTHDGFLVLEDNLRVPSGVSYMLANRRAVKTSLRNLFRDHRVRGIEHYGLLLRQTLAELAPPGISDPCIVLLTPGIHNSAFYEHIFLAREMGVELVQGEDLVVHNGFVYMRTTGGLQRVDVIYRRIDDDFLDPLAFRPDSQLGAPGLFYAYQLGNVTITNAPGTGVADDKSVYAYVPAMIRYYLGEEPLLSNVETHLCRDPERPGIHARQSRPAGRQDGGQLGRLRNVDRIRGHTSRACSICRRDSEKSGQLRFPNRPSASLVHLVLRLVVPRRVMSIFAPSCYAGAKRGWFPGAFCRVALTPGSLVVNSSQGGGGKDLWVLAP